MDFEVCFVIESNLLRRTLKDSLAYLCAVL